MKLFCQPVLQIQTFNIFSSGDSLREKSRHIGALPPRFPLAFDHQSAKKLDEEQDERYGGHDNQPHAPIKRKHDHGKEHKAKHTASALMHKFCGKKCYDVHIPHKSFDNPS